MARANEVIVADIVRIKFNPFSSVRSPSQTFPSRAFIERYYRGEKFTDFCFVFCSNKKLIPKRGKSDRFIFSSLFCCGAWFPKYFGSCSLVLQLGKGVERG